MPMLTTSVKRSPPAPVSRARVHVARRRRALRAHREHLGVQRRECRRRASPGGRAQQRVQRRALLGFVDRLAGEERVAGARRRPRSSASCDERVERGRIEALAAEVEEQPAASRENAAKRSGSARTARAPACRRGGARAVPHHAARTFRPSRAAASDRRESRQMKSSRPGSSLAAVSAAASCSPSAARSPCVREASWQVAQLPGGRYFDPPGCHVRQQRQAARHAIQRQGARTLTTDDGGRDFNESSPPDDYRLRRVPKGPLEPTPPSSSISGTTADASQKLIALRVVPREVLRGLPHRARPGAAAGFLRCSSGACLAGITKPCAISAAMRSSSLPVPVTAVNCAIGLLRSVTITVCPALDLLQVGA